MKNLSIVVSYHDLNLVKFKVLYENLKKVAHDIYLLDTNHQTIDFLEYMREKYPIPSVVFDEFNTQAYFVENIQDKNEYVYHTHYRRFFMDIDSSNLILDRKSLYLSGEHSSLKDLLKIIFGDLYTEDIFDTIVTMYSQLFGISTEKTVEIMTDDSMSPVREMYICHKDIQREMVIYLLNFIAYFVPIFNNLYKNTLDIKRITGFMIELTQGFYFKKLYMVDNYNVTYLRNYVI